MLALTALIVMVEDAARDQRQPRWLWRWALHRVDRYLER